MRPFRTAALIVTFFLGVAAAQAAEPTGTWLTQQGDARIHVAHCGNAMCGTVVWIKDAIDPATGKPPVDEKNPDPAKRNRKILGIRIFAMAPDGQGNWAGPHLQFRRRPELCRQTGAAERRQDASERLRRRAVRRRAVEPVGSSRRRPAKRGP